jgi:hypothetical protein
MLSPAVVQQVQQLLAAGCHSRRAIARMTGVSRGSISAIAHGTRTKRTRLADDQPLHPAGPPRRCPNCGGMVYWPCRLCSVRAIAAPRRAQRFGGRRAG